MEEILKQLVEMVKTMAPEVWAIYLKQVYISAINFSLWAAFWLVFTLISAKVSKYFFKKYKEEEENDSWNSSVDSMIMCFILSAVVGIVALVAFLICAQEIYGRLINPEYYVIQSLISTIK